MVLMKHILIFSFLLSGCSQIELKPFTDDVKKIINQNIVTEGDISKAFKQVLETAAENSVSTLSTAGTFLKDQSVTIPFPDQAQKVEQTLRKIGFNSMCDDFHTSMNLAAENAVKEATPIFIDAIQNITFQEATKLLKGGNTAITDFLKSKTSGSLASKFNPIISEKLETNKVTKQWNKLITKYNKLPLVKPIQADLSDHVTDKTIDAVFLYISKEETNIRQNPSQRANDLIKKVFAQAD